MTWLIGLVAIVAGALNTIQSGANATLGKGLGQPILAALIVTAVNAVAYLVSIPFFGIGLPGWDKAAALPWWAWIGGLLGGAYVLAMVFLAERLGSAIFTGLTVTAAIITSAILDHYGLVGFKEHPAGLWRIAGCALMVAGVALVSIF
jgi:bacterial/archaeal transporter family-2 protein